MAQGQQCLYVGVVLGQEYREEMAGCMVQYGGQANYKWLESSLDGMVCDVDYE